MEKLTILSYSDRFNTTQRKGVYNMSRKQFIALAEALKQLGHKHGKSRSLTFEQVVEFLAGFCATQNPSFSKERWLDYVHGRGSGVVGTQQEEVAK